MVFIMRVLIFGGGSVGLGIASCLIKAGAGVDIIGRENTEGFLEVFYKKLVPYTAEHKSSTLQDILARKKTEIDALNGAVIKLAQEYKVKVAYNLAVYNMVKFVEGKEAEGRKREVRREKGEVKIVDSVERIFKADAGRLVV